MTEIPSWWFFLSGLFFVCGTAMFLALCVMVLNLIKLVQGLEPRTKQLLDQVTGLSAQVKELVVKVETLTDKVHEVATSAKGITDSARATVDSVGGRATSMAALVEHSAGPMVKKLSSVVPYFGIAMTAIKVITAFNEMRKGRKGNRVKVSTNPHSEDAGEPLAMSADSATRS